MSFWKRKPKPETIYLDGLVTPSGNVIPLVPTPRGEEFHHYCDEVGIYRTLVDGKIIPVVPDGLTHSIIFYSWRPMKPDERRYDEAVALLRKAPWQRPALKSKPRSPTKRDASPLPARMRAAPKDTPSRSQRRITTCGQGKNSAASMGFWRRP